MELEYYWYPQTILYTLFPATPFWLFAKAWLALNNLTGTALKGVCMGSWPLSKIWPAILFLYSLWAKKRDLVWLAKSQIFTIWPCIEKVYQSLVYTSGRNKDHKLLKVTFVCSKSKFRELHTYLDIFIVALHISLYGQHKKKGGKMTPTFYLVFSLRKHRNLIYEIFLSLSPDKSKK